MPCDYILVLKKEVFMNYPLPTSSDSQQFVSQQKKEKTNLTANVNKKNK